MDRYIATLALISTFQFPIASFADTGPYQYFNSKLSHYFHDTAYLPVWPLPQGERPGDIYDGWSDLRTGFLVRSDVCFDGAPIYTESSQLIDMGHFRDWELSGNVDLPIYRVADVAVEGGRSSIDQVGLRFTGVYVSGLTTAATARELLNPADECRDALLLYGLESGAFSRTVPIILQEVVYGKPEFVFHLKRGTSVKAAAQIETEVDAIPQVSVEAGSVIRTESDFSFISTEEVPLAWRPAFISANDLERLQELEKNGFFLRLQRWMGLRGTEEEELDGIRNSFYDTVPSPDELFEQMTISPSVEFDPDNPVHLRYLQMKGQLLAISIDLYRG